MKYLFPILLTLSTLLSQKSFAQSYESPEILVPGINKQSSTQVPSAFVTIIDPKDYQDTLTTLPEILSQQVGIFVNNTNGLGQLSTVSIRGSTAEQVSVYLDGLKINTAQGGAVDFSTLPLEGLERIEIIRGGASHRYGSDAIGGVINLVSKKAKLKKTHWQAKISGGSFLTFKTHAALSKKFKQTGFNFSHSHLSSRSDFTFKETQTQLNGLSLGGNQIFTREQNAFFSEDFLIGINGKKKNFSYEISQNFFFTFRQEPGTEIETTQLAPQNPLEANRNLFRENFNTRLTWNLRDNLRLHWQPGFFWERNHFRDPSPALGPGIDVIFFNQRLGQELGIAWEKQGKKTQHLVRGFLQINWDHFREDNPILGSPSIPKEDRVTVAFMAQDEITLLGERLSILPSVRYEYANDFGSQALPHLGMIAKAKPWLIFKSNVGLNFRYPNFNELYFPDQGFVRGNPDLEKERSLSFDAGLEFYRPKLNASLSYFRQEIEDSIVFVPISAFTIAPVNTGRATTQGVEVAVYWQPTLWFNLRGNYTFIDAKLQATNNPLPGRPRHLANAKVEFKNDFFTFFSRVNFTHDLPIGFDGIRFIKQKLIFDAGVIFKIKKHYFLTLEGKNLGNVQTLDSVGFPLPRAQFYASFGYKA